jgi:serine/threonine protein kinase
MMRNFQLRYRNKKQLGAGSFGKVYLASDSKNKHIPCVVKVIDSSKMTPKEEESALMEIKIMKVLKSPFVITIRDSLVVKKSITIVMDYAEGGDLETRIQNQKGKPFDPNLLKKWIAQLLTGLEHIHDNKIIHRDLKSQNIFLTKDQSVVIGDFGVSKMSQLAETFVGSGYYLSPELVNGCTYNSKTDVWSLGVLFYELCALQYPFTVNVPSLPALALKIVTGKYTPFPAFVEKPITYLIEAMLNVDPTERPSSKQMMGYEFVKELHDTHNINSVQEEYILNKTAPIVGNTKKSTTALGGYSKTGICGRFGGVGASKTKPKPADPKKPSMTGEKKAACTGSTGLRSNGTKPSNNTPGLKKDTKPSLSSKKIGGLNTGPPASKYPGTSNLKKKPSTDNTPKSDPFTPKDDLKVKKCVSQNVEPKSTNSDYGTANSNNTKDQTRTQKKDLLYEDSFSDINDDEIIMEGKSKTLYLI